MGYIKLYSQFQLHNTSTTKGETMIKVLILDRVFHLHCDQMESGQFAARPFMSILATLHSTVADQNIEYM